jgi:uncharacterized protein
MSRRLLSAVRDQSELSVNVAELLRKPGATTRVLVESPVEGLDLPLAHVPGSAPLSLALRLDALVEGIRVSGSVTGSMRVECRRCLTEVHAPLAVEVDEVYAYAGLPEVEEGFAVHGEAVDLEPMVRDAVVLAMPLHPLCREDCRGLCPECGQDRNVVDCGHRGERVEVRWEPLSRLRELKWDEGE